MSGKPYIPTNWEAFGAFGRNIIDQYKLSGAGFSYWTDEQFKAVEADQTKLEGFIALMKSGQLGAVQRAQMRELRTRLTGKYRGLIQYLIHHPAITQDVIKSFGGPTYDGSSASYDKPELTPQAVLKDKIGGVVINFITKETGEEGIPKEATGVLMALAESDTPITDPYQLRVQDEAITRKSYRKPWREFDRGKTFYMAFRYFNRHGLGPWSEVVPYKVR
jgi:hypothetical protein